MIQATNLSKRYKETTVLDVPHLEIPSGQSFGLVGNNGAGKTTFFSLMLDLVGPSTGTVSNQYIVVNQSEEWKEFTSAFIDESFLIGYLTPEEYFHFISDLRGWNLADLELLLSRFEDFFHGEILGQKKYIRDLSKGNQKKVGIVAAFIGKPQVVILDEPFANLDPTSQIRLKSILKELTQTKEVTFLISSHDLLHVTEVCERILVLDKGSIVKDITTSPETLKELEHYFESQILFS